MVPPSFSGPPLTPVIVGETRVEHSVGTGESRRKMLSEEVRMEP
jgi:hypothetical protein